MNAAHETGKTKLDIIVPILKSDRDVNPIVLKRLGCIPTMRELRVEYIYPGCSMASRLAYESMAYYFQREFEYDYAAYHHAQKDDKKAGNFLFCTNDDWNDYAIGGLGVYWSKIFKCYCLSWVWFHPYFRRKGHLTQFWPWLKEHYPGFRIDFPISLAMFAFLKKHGEIRTKGDAYA